MKKVFWTDDSGVVRCSLLRDTDSEDHPEIGVPHEPPPIKRIVENAAMEIQNELMRMHIVTWGDLQITPNAVSAVLDRVLRRRLVEAYRLEELNKNGTIK